MPHKLKSVPIALTIAGSDSGGGAGIQADLKTFAALGCHGTSAITCVTAQNPDGVSGIQSIHPDIVRAQLDAVFTGLPPRAIKTGMLFSVDIINTIVRFFSNRRSLPLVVDPVMVATSGATLLKPSAIRALKSRLLPMATLVTPNLDEAQLLTGAKLRSLEDLMAAAESIHAKFGCAALVKGGHLRLGDEAVDVLFDGKRFTVLKAKRVSGISTHGTGCTYSAAITAHLARGETLHRAVVLAKTFITRAIGRSYRAGRHPCLNHLDR